MQVAVDVLKLVILSGDFDYDLSLSTHLKVNPFNHHTYTHTHTHTTNPVAHSLHTTVFRANPGVNGLSKDMSHTTLKALPVNTNSIDTAKGHTWNRKHLSVKDTCFNSLFFANPLVNDATSEGRMRFLYIPMIMVQHVLYPEAPRVYIYIYI